MREEFKVGRYVRAYTTKGSVRAVIIDNEHESLGLEIINDTWPVKPNGKFIKANYKKCELICKPKFDFFC